MVVRSVIEFAGESVWEYLMQLLLRTQLPELREQATGVLWNVSSSEYLKRGFLDICIDDLVRSSVIPLAKLGYRIRATECHEPNRPFSCEMECRTEELYRCAAKRDIIRERV